MIVAWRTKDNGSDIFGCFLAFWVLENEKKMQYDKHLSKKLQGQLKSNVISFCKVIISWKSDVEEIEKLLIALQALHKSLDAINKSLQTPNHSFLTARFPDLNGILVSKLLADAEAINVQLRTFWYSKNSVNIQE